MKIRIDFKPTKTDAAAATVAGEISLNDGTFHLGTFNVEKTPISCHCLPAYGAKTLPAAFSEDIANMVSCMMAAYVAGLRQEKTFFWMDSDPTHSFKEKPHDG